MAFENSFKLFLIFSGFAIATVYAGQMLKPIIHPDESYNCWIYLNCISKDVEERKSMEMCFGILEKQDIELSLKSIPDANNLTDYPTLNEAIEKLYCLMDSKERKKLYYLIGRSTIAIIGVGCHQRYPPEICDRISDEVDCMAELMGKLMDEDKCDIGNFDN